MGNDVSKEIKNIADMLEEDEKSYMTPTNKTTQFIQIDPRSPTEGIVRSPIEVRRGFKFSDQKCVLRKRWKSEADLKPGNHDFEESLYVLKDPRSPTLGIIRTPVQVSCNGQKADEFCSYESLDDTCSEQNAAINVNIVPDCRSPSLGISRTPIQIAAAHHEVVEKITVTTPSDTCETANINTTSVVTWHTPLSKRLSSPYVYTDVDSVEIKGKKDTQHEQNYINEKENDASLKRKLAFTPEPSVKSGVKIRTPLGSRCNFQDSPSQLLKIMQVQKVGQELSNGIENASENRGLVTKPIRKTRQLVEWDNKDSTIIM